MKSTLLLALAPFLWIAPQDQGQGEPSRFRTALAQAERSLEAGQHDLARAMIERALERDRKATDAWRVRARWAEAVGDRDELIYSLHQEYRLAQAQGVGKRELAPRLARLQELDPIAADSLQMKARFIKKLWPIAERYEKAKRPHAAIRVLKQLLAMDPEHVEAQASIERIASAPDPSLAGDAKPKDLFADVSSEWIAEYDAQHSEWDEAGEDEGENYITVTDAGYEVLIRTAEAMDQMNAFYREFFQYGTEEDGRSVPRIRVHVFKNRDEYLTLGIGPPVEWSGGHFTGGAVETYISSGFSGMVGTLFHEAAHQFVSLATRSVGWLNEGLASFFEGTRILPNGTVIMNMPANGRLFPLAARMGRGWMATHDEGISADDPNATPDKAPTFRIVLENKYAWGPPWYAPTWGVVYFLYNYQDPVDGRFVYRAAFREFIDKSGGRVGEGAVRNFEEVVLANPSAPIAGVERPEDSGDLALPATVEELDPVWKDWCLQLQKEQSGELRVERPYRDWGRYAALDEDYIVAKEHFEKGLVAQPDDIELLMEFADLLEERLDNPDRAAKLVLESIHYLELAPEPDLKRIAAAERLLSKLDPKRRTLARVHDEMAAAARSIVQRYEDEQLPLMVMDVSYRLARDLGLDDLYESYRRAVRQTGKSLSIWELAYNEHDLQGWDAGNQVFRADGALMRGRFGEFDLDRYDYQFLALDRITSGDFSMQADIQANEGEVNFCGFVFGQKSATGFHGLLYFPPRAKVGDAVQTGYVDLMSSYGSDSTKTWRHIPVEPRGVEGRSGTGTWVTLRLDVIGRNADIWFDGELIGTYEFPSLDVLRGGFGLLMGPGSASFKDVRYLARDARDPAGGIEREVRMEKLEAESGGAVGGSFQGKVPPFPTVSRWVQGERTSWSEAGLVPQLVVFLSIAQNEQIRVDEWLIELAATAAAYGLEMVCVCSVNDDAEIEEYLKEHPLPGAVAVDHRAQGTYGIGDSFETFFIRRFNLPRLLLLDVDQTVFWEGDPGFEIKVRPRPPFDTFLDDPLAELVERRRLLQLVRWTEEWEQVGRPALHDGNLEGALAGMQAALDFEPRYAPLAGRAAAALAAAEAALADLVATAESLAEEDGEPALVELLAWAPLLEVEVSGKTRRSLKPQLQGAAAKEWDGVKKACARYLKNKKGTPAERADGLLERLAGCAGRFPVDLRGDLEAPRAAEDWEAFRGLVQQARERPRLWLAREYFAW